MSNFQLLKVQLVALLEMLEYEYVLTGMSDIPEVSEKEVESIQEYFSSIGMISVKNGKVIPCKGLEEFMVLLDASEKIMMLNYGIIGKCTFNATLYFSSGGLLVILEVNKDVVEFLVIRSLEELRIFIPEIESYENEDAYYVSYVLCDEKIAIQHFAGIDNKRASVKVFERKQVIGSVPIEVEKSMDVEIYAKCFQNMLKEVYDATCG